jgi:hypothetical protein
MAESNVVSALVDKQAELTGQIVRIELRIPVRDRLIPGGSCCAPVGTMS